VSTSSRDEGDVITAILLKLTQHAERLAALDEREAAHYQEIAASLGSLDGLDKEVAALTARICGLAAQAGEFDVQPDADAYRPAPAPRWWKLQGEAREDALARLRAWVEQVYRPSYGHLAAALGPCWDQHPLCLFGLDWLMELWSALYLPPERTTPALAGQAEWQTRLLPALAEQMHLETSRCQHTRRTGQRQPPSIVGNSGTTQAGGGI
jgi:hypothetical protein